MRVSLVAMFALFAASMAGGQSMTSQKNQLANNGWNTPTVESSFNHCTSATESQNCWILAAKTTKPAKTVIANAGKVVAVDTSCGGYVYNDGKTNSWTYHPEWGCVQAAEYDYDGNLYALRQYNSTGKGYYWSKWLGTKWTNLSCCFQSARGQNAVWVGYDINGTIWSSPNYGATVTSHGWCAPASPSAVAPAGFDSNGNATFYVACASKQIWQFDGTNWNQLPGSATAIATGPRNQVYIVAANGNVQHWNDTSWDDIITKAPVTSLSVGGAFNVWTVGPTVSGANIYRFWEKGALISHSYSGQVSCGQGVPEALCNTFTHQLNHQICYGGHCGPIAQSSWTGAGGWGPNAQVFANPYDLWTCLLAGEPAGPCGAAENEASMECSGGGSNQDNAPQNNWVAGLSIDVMDWNYNQGPNTGPMNVTTGPYAGYWIGEVINNVREACYLNDPVPVCVAENPADYDVKVRYWGALEAQGIAYNLWWKWYDAGISGEDAPYVYYTFYIGDDISGSIFNQVCLGDMHAPDDFLGFPPPRREPPHCQ